MSDSTLSVDEHGNKRWCNKDGQYHRLDGPAYEYTNGDKRWYRNGKFHRLDGPALEMFDGTKYWYRNGKLHRLDGPAYEHKTAEYNYVDWYQRGKPVPWEQATIHLLKTKKTSHCGTRVHKSTVDLFLAPSYDYEEFLDQACKACWLLWRAEP